MNVTGFPKVVLLFVSFVVLLGVSSFALANVEPKDALCESLPVLDDADPNEPPEIAGIYWEGVDLMRQGDWMEAEIHFVDAISRYPDSRHLRIGLAEVFWYLAVDEDGGSIALAGAGRETVKAVELALSYGKVRHTWLLAQILGRMGDTKQLNSLFEQIVALEPTFENYLHYAFGLGFLDDPRAEGMYVRAIGLQPEGNIDAQAYYGEWLLDHRRETDVLDILPLDSDFEYLSFLRGVALERLKRIGEAEKEYTQFVDFSVDFPAPDRYRIPNSLAQLGIRFDKDVADIKIDGDMMRVRTTSSQARAGLSTLIYGEAGAESTGGQRAAGWVVRNRVLRGSVGSPACPYVDNSGSTLADQYESVMCQSSQFDGMCSAWCSNPSTTSCSDTPTTDHNAYDVWYGYAPDPVKSGGYCPYGYNTSTCPDGNCQPCWSVVHCSGSNTSSYSTAGGLFNYGTVYSCPSLCATSRGKVCGNGGSDNCFYSNP